MKRYFILWLMIALLLCGCQDNISEETLPSSLPSEATLQPEPTQEVVEETEPVPLYAVSVPATSDVTQAQDGTTLFTYTAQHMQLILPDAEVADKIVLDFLNRVDAAREDATNVLLQAQADYPGSEDWQPYFYQILYSPTRIDRGVLSLFGTQNSYAGGMHGSKSCIAVSYDLLTGDPLTLGSIMHQDAEKMDFIDLVIGKLDAIAQTHILFDDYKEGALARFSQDENLYEDFYFTDTGLCFFFSPYEIAPYASGIITVEIPYNELTGLIYDGYFPDEQDRTVGHMLTKAFSEANTEDFSSMAEITLENSNDTMIIYPDGNVTRIAVNIPGNDMDFPDYTVFRAFHMEKTEAIVLRCPSDMQKNITISYFSNGTDVSIPLCE